jgi:thioredoxin-like negative regulator of GroEL
MPHAMTELNDAALPGTIAHTRIPLLVVFHSRSSRPARQLVSLLEDLAPAYSGVMEFVLASAESCPRGLDNYGILTLPTCLAFRQGRLTDRFTGLLTREKLGERLEQALQAV